MDLTAGNTAGSAARHARTSSPCRVTPRRRAVAGSTIVGMVAGACYSSFLVAQAVGSRLSMTNSYVSELEVPGQPASVFFRVTDLVAALLIVVLAGTLFVRLRPDVLGTLGCLFLAGVGLASAADGLDPMPCAPSISQPCQRLDQVAIVAQLHQGHTLSSVLGVLAAQTAMLLLGLSRRVRRRLPWLGRASLAGGLLLVVLGLSEVPMTVGHGIGAVERLHVLLISAWIVALGWQLSLVRAAGRPTRSRRRCRFIGAGTG